MAQHGYLREYDEAPDDNQDRDRSRDEDHRDRDRGLMFGNREHDRSSAEDRGFFEHQGDDARERFRHEDEHRRGRSAFSSGGDWERAPRNYSSHPDDHYRSWRDKQVQALDRDYADYCREREQQFHQEFDSWRSNRRQPSSAGQQRPQQGAASQEAMELTETAAQSSEMAGGGPTPMDDATLGTNNSANSDAGLGRR
jgi:hypothetical protein